jgi:hypothetical protein
MDGSFDRKGVVCVSAVQQDVLATGSRPLRLQQSG